MYFFHRLAIALSLSFAASAIACTGMIDSPNSDEDGLFDENPSEDPNSDDVTPSDDKPDDNLARCGVPSVVADLGMRSGTAAKDSENGEDFYEATVVVQPGPPADLVWIGLFEGYGAFANSKPQAGTYTIAGEDSSYLDCGACVVLDINDNGTTPERSMMAVSGQLTINSVNGAISGSANNLVMKEIDPQSGALVPGGCETSIAGIQFSAPIQ